MQRIMTTEELHSIFFCSDIHFHHPTIIKNERRPFKDLKAMDEYFIEMWNKQVTSQNTVEYLGDFSNNLEFAEIKSIVSRLQGTINITLGNTDNLDYWLKLKELGLVNEVSTLGKKVVYEDYTFYLTHYPLDIGVRHNWFNIHGHIHSRPSILPNQLNVSVESPLLRYKPLGYMPSFTELLVVANERESEIKHFFEDTYQQHLFNSLYTRGLK